MEIYVLSQNKTNGNYETVGVIDTYYSLIWTDRFAECGEFQLELKCTTEMVELFDVNRVLRIKQSDKWMRIEKIEIKAGDADKADNFRVKQEEEIETLLYMSSNLEQIENEIITPIVYEQFMSNQLVVNDVRVTSLDHWVSYFAFIYDFE